MYPIQRSASPPPAENEGKTTLGLGWIWIRLSMIQVAMQLQSLDPLGILQMTRSRLYQAMEAMITLLQPRSLRSQATFLDRIIYMSHLRFVAEDRTIATTTHTKKSRPIPMYPVPVTIIRIEYQMKDQPETIKMVHRDETVNWMRRGPSKEKSSQASDTTTPLKVLMLQPFMARTIGLDSVTQPILVWKKEQYFITILFSSREANGGVTKTLAEGRSRYITPSIFATLWVKMGLNQSYIKSSSGWSNVIAPHHSLVENGALIPKESFFHWKRNKLWTSR
jgi:hypothetical protein